MLIVPLAALVVALTSAAADVLQRQADRGELGRIDLDADRRLLLAADRDLGDAGHLRDLLGEEIVGVVVDGDERQRVGMRRQHQDRRSRPD